MILRANCKINIGLDVVRLREDGYRDISTVMYPVRGLYDVLEIEADPSLTHGIELIQKGLTVDCPAEKNICTKAWRLMHERYGIGAVRITLDKRVPFGAGLGGGSADGTAVIVAVNEIFQLHLTENELIECAAALGSDTAFFVRNTPQLCEGRGEVMTPVSLSLSGLWMVVAKPDDSVSTAEAYAGVTPAEPAVSLAESVLRPVSEWQGVVKNDFEESVFASHPRIAQLKASLLEQGAIYASMSGSGSSCFGLFADRAAAESYRPPFGNVFIHTEQA